MSEVDPDASFAAVPDQMDIPLIDVQLINDDDVLFTDPSSSFWTDKAQTGGKDPIVLGRVVRTDKRHGRMKVIGISEDINVDVPIASPGVISSDYLGEVSQPGAGAHVVLGRTPNDDFYPLAYVRPYSEEEGFNHGVPDEMEEGDVGWVTRGGARFFIFEGGLVQMESSPNCVRLMHAIDDGEKIHDICREYGLFTDAGGIRAVRRTELTDFTTMFLEAAASGGTSPDPLARIAMGALNDVGSEVGIKLQALKSNVKGVETEGPSIKLQQTGVAEYKADKTLVESTIQTDIKGPRVTLGDPAATEPVALGLKLLARIEAVESYLALHVHGYVNAPPNPKVIPTLPATFPTPTPEVPIPQTTKPPFLSSTVFSK